MRSPYHTCQVNWPPYVLLPVGSAEQILLPVSEYGFVLLHESAMELFACFWITKSFAWGARKIYGFGLKLQNLAISARQKLAANFAVFGDVNEYIGGIWPKGFYISIMKYIIITAIIITLLVLFSWTKKKVLLKTTPPSFFVSSTKLKTRIMAEDYLINSLSGK